MAKKAIKPNIVRGGIGIPIPGKTNYYYMKGRKHKDGGIDIGSNPHTGLEVEDGEIIHLTDNNIKVFSSVPFLNGQSPAEKVIDGDNPNKVFKQQEDFKDKNNLNDDGTRKAWLGKQLKDVLVKGAQLASEASRDVRTGGASSHVKELVNQGRHEDAKQFAENYFKANTLGISLGGGAASNKLITDLLITTGTSVADTGANFITKDAKLATKQSATDAAINIGADVLGKGITKVLDTGPIKQYIGKKLGYVKDMNGYIKEGSHFRIVDKPAIDDAIQSGLIRAKTGLYHGTPEYLRENFSKYLPQLGDWENMDAFEIRKRLKELGAIGENNLLQTMYIRNSTNHGGTVGYFRNTPYPNYTISKSNYVIETPENLGVFVPGHHGKEYVDVPLENAGATVLKTNDSIKGASIPTKGSSYWQYSPFWDMWKNTKFTLGGEKTFNEWFKTIPKEINDTTNYNLRRAYETLPKDELENWRKGKGHLRSVVELENGDFEFLKSKNHPTYQKEIDWYNSNDAKSFRENYVLDDSTEYPKYIRKNKKAMGGKMNKPVSVTVNGKTKVVYSPSTGRTRSEAEGIRDKALLGEERELIENYHTRRHIEDNWNIPELNYNISIPITSNKVNKVLSYYTPNLLPKIKYDMKNPVIIQNKTNPIKPITTVKTNNISGFNNNNKNLTNDGISLTGNIIGSLLSYNTNRRSLNKMKSPSIPISQQATKLKTKININPQLDKMRETLEKYNTSVDANTASSRVALARKNRASANMLAQYNSLLGDKENKETTLINQDRLNRQSIANQNIANYNTYLTNKTNFENKIRELKGENKVNPINNINSAIQNTISTREKRRRDRNSLIAVIAANPNVNPQMLKDLGFDGITQKEIDLINKNR